MKPETHRIQRTREAHLSFEKVEIDRLKSAKRNARKHDEAQLTALVKSMGELGQIAPIIVDDDLRIVAGHARWEAAKRLGLGHVAIIRVGHLSEDQLRLYAIADNRIAERASWDEQILAVEFKELEVALPEISLSLCGFDLPKIDVLTASLDQITWSDLDEQPEPTADRRAVTRLGDVWEYEQGHRLVCGDSTDPAVIVELMGQQRARLLATDPPYNLRARSYSGKGRHKHDDFKMGGGELSPQEFTDFLSRSMAAAIPCLQPGALLYGFMDSKHVREIIGAADANGLSLLNICVWDKGKGGMGAFYRSAHELVFVLKYGDAPHKNRVELGRHGRDRTTLWRYEGFNTFSRGRERALSMHATVKPVQMICDLLLDCTDRGDIVFDGFGGSGTTLIAAEKLERVARIVELDPSYCDTIVERYRLAFDAEPIHRELKVPFSTVKQLRESEATA